jgi:oligopeptide transport system ATP-binding protein
VTEPLISVRNLTVRFDTYAGVVHALNGISFDLYPGEVFGLVGETGCGKSVTGLSLLRLIPPPGQIVAGQILFHGQDLLAKSEAEMQTIRGRRIAMIFQDPAAALNPVFTIGQQIELIIRHHHPMSPEQARRRAIQMLHAVGMPEPEHILTTYPHQLSGGMQQRAMIAMALSSGAELLIADEPTTALDVTIQAQILDLLVQLKQSQGITILLITHDLGVVAEVCDRVAVLYAGLIVETGPTASVFRAMKHPYTQGLLAAIPRPGSRGHLLQAIPGTVPSGLDPLPGCPFHPRCGFAMEVCRQERPALLPAAPMHQVACHLVSQTSNVIRPDVSRFTFEA